MILQLNPTIGCYIPRLSTEGYIHFLVDRGNEDFFFFLVLTDKGEWWVLNNREVRGIKNSSLGRDSINNDNQSAHG